jgi:REP-associated tyrosine transposase
MPRKSRIDAAGAVHHVMVRDIGRGTVFSDDADRDNFQQRLIGIRAAWATRPSRNYLVALTLSSEYSIFVMS